ncbi:hypothetical protein ACIBG3_23805 [Paenibacillus glucanolyticus]|uniref:Transposase n=1 Tax=Paenibacillus provencensis TaxID=441151 RepID=A0ABW3PUH6_9BACL|nr:MULTISPECIES: hypothetical protein [Paenibacillaceae]
MISHPSELIQMPNELKPAFQELKVMQHLQQAGFRKRFGFSCARLFQLVFVLLFHQKNWFRLLESRKDDSKAGKAAVYCFLNHAGFAWRRFLTSLSVATMKKVEKVDALTSADRDTVFIVDDLMFEKLTYVLMLSRGIAR